MPSTSVSFGEMSQSWSVGVIAAARRGGALDAAISVCSLIAYSLPVFWLGLALILIFYVALKNPITDTPFFPLGGMYTTGQEGNALRDVDARGLGADAGGSYADTGDFGAGGGGGIKVSAPKARSRCA